MATEKEISGSSLNESQNFSHIFDKKSQNSGNLPEPDLTGLSVNQSGEVIQTPINQDNVNQSVAEE
jgi:hypothetical protein